MPQHHRQDGLLHLPSIPGSWVGRFAYSPPTSPESLPREPRVRHSRWWGRPNPHPPGSIAAVPQRIQTRGKNHGRSPFGSRCRESRFPWIHTPPASSRGHGEPPMQGSPALVQNNRNALAIAGWSGSRTRLPHQRLASHHQLQGALELKRY